MRPPEEQPADHAQRPELLAPAGDWSAFEAALQAGADAVYLGLTGLNARHKARNFSVEELGRAVEQAHARGARVYLTLNVDLAERELGLAARSLEVARRAGVDAVLVRDPALLALAKASPGPELHFSTQACVTSSADVHAAKALGIARVVLARELSLEEIAAASAHGVETEVFAQGALCFSVSGRCLLSSWVGGRSGNRGYCTSPCRVPWTADGAPLGTPMSMRDLAVVHRLPELGRAGVRSLKIEGRLKTARWVGRAVELYRRGLDEPDADPAKLLEQAAELGGYTGRQLTCGYLDADRAELTGVSSGRGKAALAPAAASADDGEDDGAEAESAPAAPAPGSRAALKAYDLTLHVDAKAIVCRCEFAGSIEEWSLPKSEVRRAHKAVPIGALFDGLRAQTVDGVGPSRAETNDPEYLLVPRVANAIGDRIAAFVRRTRRSRNEVKIELPEAVRALLAPQERAPDNRRALGQAPDRARVWASDAQRFLAEVEPSSGTVVEGLDAEGLRRLLGSGRRPRLAVALPPVFFEADVPPLRELVEVCREKGLRVEVNGWGGWWLAREARVRMEAGPGLAVLNSLAARSLVQLGVESVTLSVEADREQLEEATAKMPAPCSLIVYGRPALMTSRVELSADAVEGRVLEDRRGVRLSARREGGLWVLRPREPFDLRGALHEGIRARHLVMDLVGSPDPVADWKSPASTGPLKFNYGRTLA